MEEVGRFLAGPDEFAIHGWGCPFPNTVEYWGPTGMVFFRNVQLRYAPMLGENELFLALERPGASVDQGTFQDRTELDSVRGHFLPPGLFGPLQEVPDPGGHIQLARHAPSVEMDGTSISRADTISAAM